MAHSRSFLANQKARNAIVGAENLLKTDSRKLMFLTFLTSERFYNIYRLFNMYKRHKFTT